MICAESGKEGLEKAALEKPDLILIDFMMPEMDGCETTWLLRANPATKGIPILAVTALLQPADLQTCIDAGCNDYIVQPFTTNQLLKTIKALIS